MNELHKAYTVLGLEPGSSMDAILRRYKRLIMVWHPDRAPSPEHKEFAEDELKKINNAKDILTKHFGASGGHRASGCACQADQASSGSTRSASGGSSGPGPNYQRTKTDEEKYREEQAAKKRDAERKAKEEQEANAKRAEQERQQRNVAEGLERAVQQQRALADEKLRWQISIGIVLAFIGLEVFGWAAVGVKGWWHDVTWKWQNEHSTSNTPPANNNDAGSSLFPSGSSGTGLPTSSGTSSNTSPFGPPQAPPELPSYQRPLSDVRLRDLLNQPSSPQSSDNSAGTSSTSTGTSYQRPLSNERLRDLLNQSSSSQSSDNSTGTSTSTGTSGWQPLSPSFSDLLKSTSTGDQSISPRRTLSPSFWNRYNNLTNFTQKENSTNSSTNLQKDLLATPSRPSLSEFLKNTPATPNDQAQFSEALKRLNNATETSK